MNTEELFQKKKKSNKVEINRDEILRVYCGNTEIKEKLSWFFILEFDGQSKVDCGNYLPEEPDIIKIIVPLLRALSAIKNTTLSTVIYIDNDLVYEMTNNTLFDIRYKDMFTWINTKLEKFTNLSVLYDKDILDKYKSTTLSEYLKSKKHLT